MKHIFTLLIGVALSVISVSHLFAQKPGIIIEKTIILPTDTKENTYTPFSESIISIDIVSNHLKAGEWHLLKRYFKNTFDYEKLIKEFSFQENEITTGRFNANSSTPSSIPLLSRLKPYRVKEVEGNIVRLINIKDSSLATVNFSFTKSDNSYAGFYIIDAKASFSSILKKQAASATSVNNKAISALATISSNFQYVLLPDSTNKVPSYYTDFQDYFSGVKSSADEGASVHYKQIDFEKLKIKFKWCKKVGPIKVCGKEEINYEFGKVISAKDVPGNENGMNNMYFVSPVDMTCFCNPFAASYTQFPGIILTAVIVDSRLAKITFLREGLEPLKYGGEEGEVSFDRPIAASFIGGFLYVLDKGNFVTAPNIKVLKINHATNGDFSIVDVGTITSFGGTIIEGPSDLGGYTGTTSNTLLVADDNGLNALEVNTTTGLPLGTSPRLYRSALNPQTNEKYPHFINIRRLDASTNAGTTVVITNNGDVISFSNTQTSSANATNVITIDYLTSLTNGCNPSNLAYMEAEQKWYITDFVGKVHTLTKEGRYISGGGKNGTSEGNEELSYPFGITPNCITDPNNNYRYRYIIGNEWSYDTGFKLFAPEFQISRFKVFENLTNGTLNFTFTTSGRWQHTENATGLSFHAMLVNGQAINASLWNTQISPGTPSSPGNDLTGNPNTISLTPNNIPNLKRGWNQVEIIAKIYIGTGTEAIFKNKKVNFYWLPSTFTPSGPLSYGRFKLNQYSELSGLSKDYIYKPITLGNYAGFYSNGHSIIVSEAGNIQFGAGSTFYNSNTDGMPLENIDFLGESKFTIGTGAYICTNNTGPKNTFLEFQDKLVLQQGYKLGTNPSNLEEYANASCNAPCNFIDPNSPKIDFTTDVSLISGPNFNVLVDPLGTTYADRVKWEVAKITNGTSSNYASQTFEGKASAINLRTALNYTFQPCSQYNITLSLGCNDAGFVKLLSKTINTSPIVTVSGGTDPETVCSNQTTAKFTGSPIGGKWSSSHGTITLDGVLTISTVPVNTDITLTYTFTDAGGCIVPATKIVRVLPPLSKPIANITNPVCEGANLTLSTAGSYGAIYNWILPTGDTMIVANASETYINTSLADQGTYRLFITKDGCKSPVSDPIQLIVKPKPLVEAGDTLFKCLGDAPFTITGQTPLGGIWSGNGITAQGLFTPSSTGYGYQNLTYTVTSSNGCINSDVKTIIVGPIVEAGVNDTVCVNRGSYQFSGFSPQGGIWSGTGVSSAGLFTPSIAGVGTKTVTYSYTHPTRGCINSDTKTIVIRSGPLNPIVSNNGPKCYNETIQLTASTIAGATYRWTGPNNFTSTEQNPIVTFKDGQLPGTYSVVTIANGCEGIPQNTQVIKHTTPDVSAGTDTLVCSGSPSIVLKGTPTGGTWSGVGVTGNVFNPNISGGGDIVITYTYISPNGCSANDTKRIKITPPPTVNVLSNKSSEECAYTLSDLLLIADIKEGGTFSFQWYRNDVIILNATSQTYSPTQPGKYCVTVLNPSCGSSSACFALENVPVTKLKTSDCNIALTTIFQPITCDAVTGAIAYEYRVNDPLNNKEIGRITKLSASPSFSLSEIDGIKYNKTYDIFVRVFKGDNSTCSIFGNACKLTTPQLPTTQLRTEDCNITLTSPTQTIIANPIPGATFYEYRIKNYGTTTEIARVLRSSDSRDLAIYNIPGLLKGASYDVDIRAFISVNNVWGTYGNVCKVTVPCLVTMPPGNYNLCSGGITNIPLQSIPSGASFTWTATLLSGAVTGFSNGSGNVISQVLNGYGVVTYQITPTLGCLGGTVSYNVNVKSLPSLSGYSKGMCSGWSTGIILSGPIDDGATRNWTASLLSGNVSGYSNGTGNIIDQHLIGDGLVKYSVTPTMYGCSGPVADFIITVRASPNLIITNPTPVNYPQTVDITKSFVDLNNTNGTVTYWKNAEGTIPLLNPTSVQQSGNYWIEKKNGSCFARLLVEVKINYSWVTIASGYSHCFAINSDGSLWGWGLHSFQVNDQELLKRPLLLDKSNWSSLSGGFTHSLGIKQDGSLWGWGSNYKGQLGDGTTAPKGRPIMINGGLWKKVECGFNFSLCLKSDGTIWATGSNDDGELGNGKTTPNSLSLVRVGNQSGWIDISVKGTHAAAINANGELYEWGRVAPNIVIPGLTKFNSSIWKKVEAGYNFTVGIKQDGTLWSWGANDYGQLGIGAPSDPILFTPTQVGTANNWKDISISHFHCLAIKNDNSLWGWGLNDEGQLGDGTNINRYTPKFLNTNALQIEALWYNSFIRSSSGQLCTTGANDAGELGDGTTVSRNSFNCLSIFNPNMPSSVLRMAFDEEYPQNDELIVLEQNIPNPSNQLTIINYSTPESDKNAKIKIYSMDNRVKEEFTLQNSGPGSIMVDLSNYKPGIYIYSLVLNGKIMDTKKMVVIK